jgi:hypothetical protein
MHRISNNQAAACLFAAFVMFSLVLVPSCARKGTDRDMKLTESTYGFYLGETKEELFKRAQGVITMTKAPDPPLGYRGELWNCSGALVFYPGVDHVRLAFFRDRLWEIIVYFRNTSAAHIELLKRELEAKYQAHATAPDGTTEEAAKTYRLSAPGISITLRRITKKNSTELYVQYFHDELHKELIEKSKAARE